MKREIRATLGALFAAVLACQAGFAGEETSDLGREIRAVKLDGAALQRQAGMLAGQLRPLGLRLVVMRPSMAVPVVEGRVTVGELLDGIAKGCGGEVTWLDGGAAAVLWVRLGEAASVEALRRLQSADEKEWRSAMALAAGSEDLELFKKALAQADAGGERLKALAAAATTARRFDVAFMIDPARAMVVAESAILGGDKAVRAAAAGALAAVGGGEAVKLLAKALDAADRDGRSAVINAANTLQGRDALAFAKLIIAADDPMSRNAVSNLLVRADVPEAVEIIARLVKEGKAEFTIWHSLGRMSCPAAMELLKELAASEDKTVRASAVASLSYSGRADAIPLLEKALSDPETTVRQSAVTGIFMLIMQAGPGAFDLLAKALDDQDAAVRQVAARSLMHVSGPRAQELLKKALADKDAQVRAAAVYGLMRIDDPGVPALMKQALGDEAVAVRRAAAGVAASWQGPGAKEMLIERLKAETDQNVRATLAGVLRNRFGNDEDAKAALAGANEQRPQQQAPAPQPPAAEEAF